MSRRQVIVQMVEGGWLVVEPDCVHISDQFQREVVYFDRTEWEADPDSARTCLEMMATVLEGGVPNLLARYPNLRSYNQAEPRWRVRMGRREKGRKSGEEPAPPV